MGLKTGGPASVHILHCTIPPSHLVPLASHWSQTSSRLCNRSLSYMSISTLFVISMFISWSFIGKTIHGGNPLPKAIAEERAPGTQIKPLSQVFLMKLQETIIDIYYKEHIDRHNWYQVWSLLVLSFFQRSPLIFWGYLFYVSGHFSTQSFYQFWSRSPRIPQQPQYVFEGAHFCRF